MKTPKTPFPTTLFNAINSADVIICNGYEIDGFVYEKNAQNVDSIRLDCGEDVIGCLVDQKLLVNADGQASASSSEADQDHVEQMEMEFRVTKPMSAHHLRPSADAPNTALNLAQLTCLRSYAGGDFAHFTEIQTQIEFNSVLKNCGDGLLKFLMIELGDAEDCTTIQEAFDRISTTIKQLHEVGDKLSDLLEETNTESVPSQPSMG